MMEPDGRNEEAEPALGQPAPSADHPHDQLDEDQPLDKEHVTMCGLLKVIINH